MAFAEGALRMGSATVMALGGAIECWLHGSRFDLATGRVLSPPATRAVAVFAVRVDDGDVFLHLGDARCEPGG